MSVGTRRILVAHLAERRMSVPEIASELGVSKETVRRDLHNPPPAVEPETPPDVAPPAPGLVLPESKQLRQDLNVLTTAFRGKPEDVARFAIHQAAQPIRQHWQARMDARAEQQEARS
ncbi:helix-turn-helix domain-containing protein [Streptomyces sp. NBC_00620]|uniref:DeoR family transcriptional regulator n=1 Tax=Streptomyces sp. NBC_00620 TaxID=2903666 RepID=UPI00225414D2|nr:helix-turn-helix domain-containing protein [Streptomyces sp. NBC_00620]MCX4973165.1 helix-turn-helix domain-containing protein [Streptomyces sp. NBC_00620]